jgi:hypothetical protein
MSEELEDEERQKTSVAEYEASKTNTVVSFVKQLCDVLHRTKKLRYISFTAKYIWRGSASLTSHISSVVDGIGDILNALLVSEAEQIDLVLPDIQRSTVFNPLVIGLGRKRLFKLTIPAHTTPPTLILVSMQSFQHLEALSITAPDISSPLSSSLASIPTILDEDTDWEEILSNSCLKALSLATLTVQSLPARIEKLELVGKILPANTWKVICGLKYLVSLRLDYDYTDSSPWGPEFNVEFEKEFNSHGLLHLELFSGHDDKTKLNKILRPILGACKDLSSFILEGWVWVRGPEFLRISIVEYAGNCR